MSNYNTLHNYRQTDNKLITVERGAKQADTQKHRAYYGAGL